MVSRVPAQAPRRPNPRRGWPGPGQFSISTLTCSTTSGHDKGQDAGDQDDEQQVGEDDGQRAGHAPGVEPGWHVAVQPVDQGQEQVGQDQAQDVGQQHAARGPQHAADEQAQGNPQDERACVVETGSSMTSASYGLQAGLDERLHVALSLLARHPVGQELDVARRSGDGRADQARQAQVLRPRPSRSSRPARRGGRPGRGRRRPCPPARARPRTGA